MSFKKSGEARQAARSRALLDGPLPGQRVQRHGYGPLLFVEHPLSELPRPVDDAATADAGVGADPSALRLSPAPRVAAARRLGAREEALLARLHRGRTDAPTEASVSTCDRRAPRAAPARDHAQ